MPAPTLHVPCAHVTCTRHMHTSPPRCTAHVCMCMCIACGEQVHLPAKARTRYAPTRHAQSMHQARTGCAPMPCAHTHICDITSHHIYIFTLSSRRREGYRPPVVEPSPPACNTSGCRLARSRGNKSPVCTFTVYDDRAATHIKCTRTLLLYACACEPPVCVQGRACHQSSVRCSCCGRPTSHWSWGRSWDRS